MKVGTHEKSYRTFVGNAIYVSVPGLIDPRVMSSQDDFTLTMLQITVKYMKFCVNQKETESFSTTMFEFVGGKL